MAEQQIESQTITPTTTPPAAPSGIPATELAKVRDLVIKTTPNVVPELVTGSNLDELLASVDNAVAAYDRIAQAVAPPAASAEPAEPAPNVPAGAHVAVNLDDLPSMELIRRGVAELKRR